MGLTLSHGLKLGGISLQNGALLNQIPAANLATMWLDGSIVDVSGSKYFVNKKGDNVLITGYDFPDGWVKGFPYKSAATIDVFGLTSVPVVSLFQNFDNENQYFTKHIAQVVNVNGVETSQAYVSDIVEYSAPLTGADLTAANTYYAVPVELGTEKWVTKAGNDLAGNGSKTTPYLTIEKAYKTFPVDSIVNVKSGIYAEEHNATTIRYFYADKANGLFSIAGIGFVNIISVDTSYVIRLIGNNSITKIDRIIFNAEGNTTNVFNSYSPASTKLILSKCLLKGATSNNILTSISASIHEFILTNCVVLGNKYLTLVDGAIIDTCYITAQINFGTIIKNSKIVATTVGAIYVRGASMQVIGNKIETTRSAIVAEVTESSQLEILNNDIKVLWTEYLAQNIKTVSINNLLIKAIVKNNKIVQLGYNASDTIYLIILDSCNLPVVEKNILSIASKVKVVTFSVTAIFSTKIVFCYNYILSNKQDGADILIGGESTGFDLFNESEVIGNHYVGYKRNYPSDNVGITVHCLFIGCSKNNVIKWNNIGKGDLGVVIKTGIQQAYTVGGFFNNIITDCRKGLWVRGVLGLNIFNNTIIHSNNSYGVDFQECIYADENSAASGDQFSENIIVKNNILVSFRNTGRLVGLDNHLADNGFESDYNIFYSPVAAPFRIGLVSYSFAEWQALGYDTHSIMLTTPEAAKALFVDYDNENYALASGSAAIGAGVDLGEYYDDGLDASTTWGSETRAPVIVTKQQAAAWDCGAYVH